ncbi:MAG: VWA domain-containing protein [Candidatus Omnitrophica bacterium]|nr:VWA domain-containing protein [Candidatus Omnitrophota bacterium]
MIFTDAWVLILIPLACIIVLAARIRYRERTFLFPDDTALRDLSGGMRIWLARKLWYLKVAALVCLLAGLARPQVSLDTTTRREGIAIMLAIDCSSTMLAEDLTLGSQGLAPLLDKDRSIKRLNRMQAVKIVARDFIKSRPNDLVGVVAFAAYAYCICPPTFDARSLERAVDRIEVGMIKDATAIGSGILTSINSLKKSPARSKIIILMTDGINNYGRVPPLVAAKVARSLGIKIYTIGIVSRGQTPYPVEDKTGHVVYKNVQIDVDEKILREIADSTGGNYYRVSDLGELKERYKTIDRLERHELEETVYEDRKDVFYNFLFIALALILGEIILANSILRRIP